MLRAWRIVKAKHAATAFSGEGAVLTGGRWNSRGVRVVYASSTLSLAVLESLVHLNPPVVFKYVAFRLSSTRRWSALRVHCRRTGRSNRPDQGARRSAIRGCARQSRWCCPCRRCWFRGRRTTCSIRCIRILKRSPSASRRRLLSIRGCLRRFFKSDGRLPEQGEVCNGKAGCKLTRT